MSLLRYSAASADGIEAFVHEIRALLAVAPIGALCGREKKTSPDEIGKKTALTRD
jgi:hypothetical protein